jgi:cyclic pyranopterin phosphate synthase
MSEMNHLDERGNVHMVDVGDKVVTDRVATAVASVEMADDTRRRLFSDDLPKGDALATARIAAIGGAKRTPDLIPLCHPLAISGVTVTIEQVPAGAQITVTVSVTAKTGVEMEAMTAASVGALAIYDMVKGIDRAARIGSVELLAKSGGRSGEWRRG